MSDDDRFRPPSVRGGDIAHAITRSGLGAIPFAGTASIELLNAIVTPPLEKRRTEWMEKVGLALKDLEEKIGIILETLQENNSFIDVSIEASRIAIKTSIEEKKEALKNAILNSALPEPLEQSLQNMFLSFIDIFTVWHLKLLELFNDPASFIEGNKIKMGNISMGSMSQLVENAFPELRDKRELYKFIWKDLYSRALVNTDDLYTMMTVNGIMTKRTTELGSLFLEFIKNPIKDQS